MVFAKADEVDPQSVRQNRLFDDIAQDLIHVLGLAIGA
jgi:hypothetical protein